jgi:hypothetical protein
VDVTNAVLAQTVLGLVEVAKIAYFAAVRDNRFERPMPSAHLISFFCDEGFAAH